MRQNGTRERDGDYDNTEVTSVQLCQAAVSAEREEARARTGASVDPTMTAKVARVDTKNTQLHTNIG